MTLRRRSETARIRRVIDAHNGEVRAAYRTQACAEVQRFLAKPLLAFCWKSSRQTTRVCIACRERIVLLKLLIYILAPSANLETRVG